MNAEQIELALDVLDGSASDVAAKAGYEVAVYAESSAPDFDASAKTADAGSRAQPTGGLAAVQNEFSPRFNHTSYPELQLCKDAGVTFVPWSPMGGAGAQAHVADAFPARVDPRLGRCDAAAP